MSRQLSLAPVTDRAIAGLRRVSPPSAQRLMPTRLQRRRMRLVQQGQERPGRELLGSPGRQVANVARSVLPVATTTQEVWAVTMVKDERDIIRANIEHLLDEGVDRVLVADNGSTDGTAEVLADLSRDAPVTVVNDHLTGYYQAEKMTRLARFATRAGAAWIVPFDADEYWRADDGPLGDFLRRSSWDVHTTLIYDHVPHPADPSVDAEPNPFARLGHRIAEPSGLRKVAFRSFGPARLRQGNHFVERPGSWGIGLEVRHFPYRSYEQFADKTRNGGIAMSATDLPDKDCSHWRLGEAGGEDEVRARWTKWCTRHDLVLDPVISQR